MPCDVHAHARSKCSPSALACSSALSADIAEEPEASRGEGETCAGRERSRVVRMGLRRVTGVEGEDECARREVAGRPQPDPNEVRPKRR